MADLKLNEVKNLKLHCFDVASNKKGVTLNCSLNGYDKQNDTYYQSISVRVFAFDNECELCDEEPTKKNVLVDGTISLDNYKTKEGVIVPFLKVFATKVSIAPAKEKEEKSDDAWHNRRKNQ